MLQMKLGGQKGRNVKLRNSDNIIAVRTRSHGPIRERNLNKTSRSAFKEFSLQTIFEGQEIGLWRSDQISGDEIKSILASEEQIEFAGTALQMSDSGNPVAYTEKIFLALHRDANERSIGQIVKTLGGQWHVTRRLTYGKFCYLIEPKEIVGRGIFDQAMELLERNEVDRCHPEFLRERSFRSVYPEQWHLGKRIVGGQLVDQSANVDGAWTASRGRDITIAVIDDGVDTQHPEFNKPGKIISEFDFTRHIPDARPKTVHDNHGTACAGVACASGVNGATGVAPDATLMPIRLRSALGSMDESDAIMWAMEKGADVISCSWGPPDGDWWDPSDPQHKTYEPISDNSALAIEAALTVGRQGRGCVVCWAAGNGNESVDLDGYASFKGVMAIGACSDRGDRSVYSDYGKALSCSFPSNNFKTPNTSAPLTPGIWTTDRSGEEGYNSQSGAAGEYTSGFGGTSSACPGAAGTAALVLAVDPMMTGAEVVKTIERTATKIDTVNEIYNAKGRSRSYGHGKINAEEAVYSRLHF
jgi:subtilisin family serine protease